VSGEMQTRRHAWGAVPPAVRAEVGARLGSPIGTVTSCTGGFTPGLAAVLSSADGSSAFVKALPVDGPGAATYRREMVVAAALPPEVPAPTFRYAVERDGWLLLCFTAIPGRAAGEPWEPAALASALATVTACTRTLTPNPLVDVGTVANRMGPRTHTWRALASDGVLDGLSLHALRSADRNIVARAAELEAGWTDAVWGDTLLHFDLRADNCMVDPEHGVRFVDWAAACSGPAWVETAVLLLASDLGAADPDDLLTRHPTARAAAPEAIDAFLAAMAGYWMWAGHEPPIAHAPGLRLLQRRCGDSALRWLHQRLQ